MKKINWFLSAVILLACTGCELSEVKPAPAGSTRIVASGGSAAQVFIVEKDGFLLAVVISGGGNVGITQLK